MRPLPQSGNLAIRPSIRVLGAILMLALAYVFVEGAMPLFQAEHTVYGYRSCGGGKGWWLCELGNLVASFVLPYMRGVVEGTSGLLVAGLSVYTLLGYCSSQCYGAPERPMLSKPWPLCPRSSIETPRSAPVVTRITTATS